MLTCKKCNKKRDYISTITGNCFSCDKEVEMKEICETVKKDGYSLDEDMIYCPYCGNEHEPDPADYEGDEDYFCWICKKRFIVEVEQTITFSTKQKEEEE